MVIFCSQSSFNFSYTHSKNRISKYLCETFHNLKELKLKLTERKQQKFLPINVKKIISELEKYQSHKVKLFRENVQLFYQTCIEYLNQWDNAFLEIKVFEWILL